MGAKYKEGLNILIVSANITLIFNFIKSLSRRRSFPSAHSSGTMYGMLFLAVSNRICFAFESPFLHA